MNAARRAIRDIAVRSAGITGFFAALRWLQRDRVTILCYHSVVESALPRWVSYGGLHLSANDFKQHIRYVTRHYQIATMGRVVEALREGEALPQRTLVLTFDDGYANNTRSAAKILREAGVRATLFLATDYIGQRDLFWWDELGLILSNAGRNRFEVEDPWGALDLGTDPGTIRAVWRARELLDPATPAERRVLLDRLGLALKASGSGTPFYEELRPAEWDELAESADVFEYGGHTAGHRVLDLLTETDVREEIRACREVLKERVGGAAVPAFSYPAGRYNESVVAAVRTSGFSLAVTTQPAPMVRDELGRADPWRLPRIPVTAGASPALLAAQIAGIPQSRRQKR